MRRMNVMTDERRCARALVVAKRKAALSHPSSADVRRPQLSSTSSQVALSDELATSAAAKPWRFADLRIQSDRRGPFFPRPPQRAVMARA